MTSPGGKEVGRISIRVVPDTSEFRRILAAELKAIEDSLKATIDVDIDLDTLKARGDMKVLMGKLKTDAAKGVTIETRVDKDRLGNLFSGIGGGAGGAANGLGGMGRSLGIVAAVAALAAPALALIAGVLTAMPAIIAGVLTPIAAIALGLDGIKEAAKVLAPGLDSLKKTMSEKFKDVLTKPFSDLTKIFPTLEESMPKVATALGTVAQSFVDVLTSSAGLDKIKGTITNIADTITASAPGIGKLTDGLLGLANGVSAKFPAVGKYIDDVGTSFDNWVAKASTVDASGTSPLDRAMGNLGGTLKGVLDIIGDLAKQGFDFLQDPKFGTAMQDFVKSCQTLINDILPSLKQFFIDLSGGLKGFTDALQLAKSFDPQTGKVDTSVIDDVAKNDLFAPFTSQEAGWRDMLAGLKTGWDAFLSWIKTTWGQFTSFFGQQFSVIGAAWSANWESLKAGWSAVISWFSTTGSQLTGSLSGVWNSVVSAAQAAFGSIQGFFTGIPAALSSAWSSLGSVASSAWSAVTGAVSSAWESIKSAVSTGVEAVISYVSGMGGRIISAITSIDLAGAGRALMDGLLGGIRAGAEAVYNFVSGIADTISRLKGPIPYDKKVLTPNGMALMQGLQDGIEGGFEGVKSRAQQLAQEISDAINSGMDIDAAGFNDKLKKQMDEIGLESDQLKVELNGTTDKDAKTGIRDQRTQLQTIKDQLNLQQDQLGFSTKYGESLKTNDTTMSDSLNKIVDAGKGFAESNIKQFTQDIGISGNGALSQGADQALQFGMSALSSMIGSAFGGAGTTINVGSVDDALTAKNTLANKKALQYTGR